MNTKKSVTKKVGKKKEDLSSLLDLLSGEYVEAKQGEEYQRGRADAYMCLLHMVLGICPKCQEGQNEPVQD